MNSIVQPWSLKVVALFGTVCWLGSCCTVNHHYKNNRAKNSPTLIYSFSVSFPAAQLLDNFVDLQNICNPGIILVWAPLTRILISYSPQSTVSAHSLASTNSKKAELPTAYSSSIWHLYCLDHYMLFLKVHKIEIYTRLGSRRLSSCHVTLTSACSRSSSVLPRLFCFTHPQTWCQRKTASTFLKKDCPQLCLFSSSFLLKANHFIWFCYATYSSCHLRDWSNFCCMIFLKLSLTSAHRLALDSWPSRPRRCTATWANSC